MYLTLSLPLTRLCGEEGCKSHVLSNAVYWYGVAQSQFSHSRAPEDVEEENALPPSQGVGMA